MINEKEILYKIVQAFVTWEKQGGPSTVSISETTRIFKKKYPTLTEDDIRTIVKSNNDLLQLDGENISLSNKIKSIC